MRDSRIDEPGGSERSARSAIDSAHEAFVGMDAQGLITDWNLAAETTFGLTREEALGRVLAETIIPERTRDRHRRGLGRFLETGEGPILNRRVEVRALHRDGYEFPVEITISSSGGEGDWSFYAFLHDISQRSRSEQFLRAQHAVTVALAEAKTVHGLLPDVLRALGEAMQWWLAAYWQPDGAKLRCSLTWQADQRAKSALLEASRRRVLSLGEGLPGQVWALGEPVWMTEVTKDRQFVRTEAAARDGLHAAIAVPVPGGDGVRGIFEFFSSEAMPRQHELVEMMASLSRQVGHFLDILEERSELVSRLKRLATTDELTGIPNRRGWDEALRREIAGRRRDGAPLWVALLDLDEFKFYNDEYGHLAGDDLLRQAVREWRSQLRMTDVLARYGGEEFVLVFSTDTADLALGVVERLRTVTPRGLTCSAGLVRWDGHESPHELVGRADAALYEAKRAGRDRTVLADG